MDPITAIAAANAAMALVESLLPSIKALAASGQISPEAQQEVHDRYNALRAKGDQAFQGPEWEVTPV